MKLEPITLNAEQAKSGRLDQAVRLAFALSHAKAQSVIQTGKLFLNGKRALKIDLPIMAGDALLLDWNAPDPAKTEPFGVRCVYIDDDIVVIDKPAHLPASPLLDDPEAPNALIAAQRLCHGPRRPKIVHRLDLDTSGLMVFARSVESARILCDAIERHELQRTYRAVVQGCPEIERGLISSMMLRDVGQGKRGSRKGSFKVRPLPCKDPGPMPGYGKLAITRYEVIARSLPPAEPRAALEIRLSTGRTHQIRIHMAELGCPLLGERVYAKTPGAPRQALHSAKLAFVHPVTKEPMNFESPWPEDLADVTPIGKW